MNKFKIISAVLLAVFLAFSLCACGEVPEEAGRYTGAGFRLAGVDYADSSLASAYVDLGSGGRGILAAGEESGRISWKTEGEKLKINAGGSDFYGTLTDGVLTLEIGQELNVIFLKEGAKMPDTQTVEMPLNYYGWWRITDSEGEMPETWIDCCARLSLEEGRLYFNIWDEDGSAEQPMGKAVMGMSQGVPVSQWGQFWYSELSEGQWQLKAEMQEEMGAELIKLCGEAADKEGGKFSYEIYLRPWGEKWDEANKDAVPYYYNSWYLPLIQEGAEMPDSFEGAESPLNGEKPHREDSAENAENDRPTPKPAVPQITKPKETGQIPQGNKDFNDDEMSGFTDEFGS